MVTRVGYLEDTLAGIDAALEAGFNPVKINAVTVAAWIRIFLGFAKLSIDRPLHVRFIEYMPVGESSGSDGMQDRAEKDVIPSEELLETINERAREMAGLRPRARTGRSAGDPRAVRVPGGEGHGRLHLAALASFLLGVQPHSPDGRRQDPPVLVQRHRIRCEDRVARRRRRRRARGSLRGARGEASAVVARSAERHEQIGG